MRALVIDNGEYTGFAERLARDMEVAYYSPWERAYPLMRHVFPGYGLPNVTRINDPLAYLHSEPPDLVVIPDLFHNDLDHYCRELGLPVFSAADGTQLETDREFLNDFLRAAKLRVVPSEKVEGVEALREYLQDPENEDRFIKLSTFRGDLNTFHHQRWASSSVWMDDITHGLGPCGPMVTFLVQKPIKDAIELSIEGIFVEGTLLMPYLLGYEIKDAGEIACFQYDMAALPVSVQAILKALSRYFAHVKYRNLFAIEIRLTEDGNAFLLDVACRVPIPPGTSLIGAINNLGDVINAAANGTSLNLDVGDTRFIAEMELNSPWTIQEFLQVHCPPKLRSRLGLRQHCQIDESVWCIPRLNPRPEIDAFGAVFGLGASIDEAADECIENAEEIEAYQMYCAFDFRDKAMEVIKQGRKLGVEF